MSSYYNPSYPSSDYHRNENEHTSAQTFHGTTSLSPQSHSQLPLSSPRAPLDNDPSPPPMSSSNTYHLTQTGNATWELPPGWKIAYREHDGRMYYFELATGKTSWSHPFASLVDPEGSGGRGSFVSVETPQTASRRPDSHQCLAAFACFVFPPLGIPALIHSFLTYRAWSRGRYGDAYDHSRQAYNFAWWAVALFVAYVIYRIFWDGGPGWEFFRFWDW